MKEFFINSFAPQARTRCAVEVRAPCLRWRCGAPGQARHRLPEKKTTTTRNKNDTSSHHPMPRLHLENKLQPIEMALASSQNLSVSYSHLSHGKAVEPWRDDIVQYRSARGRLASFWRGFQVREERWSQQQNTLSLQISLDTWVPTTQSRTRTA